MARQTRLSRRWTRSCECPPAARLHGDATLPPTLCPSPHGAPASPHSATANTRHREKKEGKYLKELSELGHFLKGSSATLGLTKVKDSCEKIQHYGQLKDDAGTKDITEEQAQENLGKIIKQAKKEFADVKDILKEFYKDDDEA